MNIRTILKKAFYIIIPIAVISFVAIKLKNNKEITQSKVYQYDKKQAISVLADTVEDENVNAEFSYPGTFEPEKETKISAEVQGKINKVFVDVGNKVNKGQTLIQLDNSLLRLSLQSVEVQIEGLEADVNRYTILANADAIQGIQLEKAVLGLKSAKVQKAVLLEQIYKTTIKAPFSGLVTAKLSEEGAFAAPGVALLQLTDISNLKFTINVPENELSKFSVNKNYSIKADAYTSLSISGKATMIGSKANIGSSFPVQFSVQNTPDLTIKSGMFGVVNIKGDIEEKGIIISSSAVVGTESQPQVYVIKNGKAILHDIIISKRIQNNSIVSGGLKSGDVVITNGFINLFNGANVSVNKTSE